ncbi:MAG: hypothetical protein LBE12_06370 [Planctomycetaceae bacterium]|nr:hypothetical protein [Planctomycetaceae bacterium]
MSMAMSIGIGISIGALSGGASLGVLSAVNGGDTRTNISYTLKGAMYGGLLGAAIAFSVSTNRVPEVIISGFLSGAANAICSFLTSDNGALAQFMFIGIQNGSLDWTPVGMAFLDGLAWGAAAESFGYEEVIPNKKTDIYRKIKVAAIAAATETIAAYVLSLPDPEADHRFVPFLAKLFTNVVKAAIFQGVIDHAMDEWNITDETLEALFATGITLGIGSGLDMVYENINDVVNW